MKKSEQYMVAMKAVLRAEGYTDDVKLEVLETLMAEKSSAEWSEKREEEKKNESLSD